MSKDDQAKPMSDYYKVQEPTPKNSMMDMPAETAAFKADPGMQPFTQNERLDSLNNDIEKAMRDVKSEETASDIG